MSWRAFGLIALGLSSAACSPSGSVPAEAPPRAAAVPGVVGKSSVEWLVTTGDEHLAKRAVTSAGTSEPAPSTAVEVRIDPAQAFQTMQGFGGAFNEHGWDALGVLDAAERAQVLRALFDPEQGLGFNYCRVPIGASDYAIDRYTLDETPGDFAMDQFSIARDRERLIPYIQAARSIRPDLKLWGSAWTPPTWMKTNQSFDSGAMKDDTLVYAAYALYLARFVEEYAREGLNISMLVPQNEPGQLTRYPSCDWTPNQYITFIRDHLGPTFRKRRLRTDIYVGTVNRPEWDALSVLNDPEARSYVSGIALQWFGLSHAGPILSAYPQLTFMQSETDCGNHPWEPEFQPETPQNDFTYAAYTFRKFRDYIQAGASSYMLWNMVLDEHGKNLDSQLPWPQNSAIVVDRQTRQVTYTPLYWMTKHFSSLVRPGAQRIATLSSYADQIAFKNPDGTLIVELLNEGNSPIDLQVQAGQRRHLVQLPAQSFATLVIPKT
ncbi:MAG TPA: glycoside hydrolase family 30 beta sandwich domain-containing protein [Polyangiaceae bacterium]|nr:glycoside hydrolase family 30 beta sandwich domain-containing protein [Polyangiaceae bacterium]